MTTPTTPNPPPPSTQRQPASPLDRALTRREEGDIDGAIAILRSAIANDLNDLGLITTLAKMLAESDQLDKAQQWYRRALAMAPDDPDVNFGYGTFLGQSGRFAEAKDHFVRAERVLLEIMTNDRDDWAFGLMGAVATNHARVCCELGELDAARAILRPWFRFEDSWPGAFDVLDLLIDKAGLDPDTVLDEGLVSGLIAPPMIEYRLGELFAKQPVDLVAIDQLIARADQLFDFDWTSATDTLPGLLADLRITAQRAMMKGELAADTIAHVLRIDHPGLTDGAEAASDTTPDEPEPDPDEEADDTASTDSSPTPPPQERVGWDRVTLARVRGPLFGAELGFAFLRYEKQSHLASGFLEELLPLPESLARDVALVATQAMAGFKPSRSRRQVPLGCWSLEAFGHPMSASLMITWPDSWEVVAPILNLLQLHARLLEKPADPYAPFEVLRVVTPDPDERGIGPSIVSVEARFTTEGFRFRKGLANPKRARRRKPYSVKELGLWLAKSTDDIEYFLPPLWVGIPTFVHPVAAFELYEQALLLDEHQAFAKGEDGWRAACGEALRLHLPHRNEDIEDDVAELRSISED